MSDVIALVVLWRLRYKLSLRDLPEMFLVRGLVFSHEAVREREAKLAPALAEELRRRRRGEAGRSWYVDETYIPEQRPQAAAAAAAAAGHEGGAGRADPLRAARHPALAGSRPGLLPARARPLRRLSSTLAILGRLEERMLAVSGPWSAPPRTRPAPSAPAPPPRGRPRSRTGDRWPPGPASRAPAAAPRRGPPRAARGRPAR